MNHEQIKHDNIVKQNEAEFIARKKKELKEIEQIESRNKLDFSNSNQDIDIFKSHLKKLFESIDHRVESSYITEDAFQNDIDEAIETAKDLREALEDADKQDKLDELIIDKLDELKEKSETYEHNDDIVEMFVEAKDSYIKDNQIEISSTKQIELER